MIRIYLIAVSVFGLAIAAIAPGGAPSVDQPAPERCEAAAAPSALVAAGTRPNNVCPPPKVCCGWKDPGHHICNRCC